MARNLGCGGRQPTDGFDLSRYMGASLTMIDRHYGHLSRDGRKHAIRLLDTLGTTAIHRWTFVDASAAFLKCLVV